MFLRKYSLVEEKRPGQYFDVFEDDGGSYILNSEDLRMIGHLQELGHPKERFRWTYRNGLDEKRRIEETGGTPAIMPLWGDRIF